MKDRTLYTGLFAHRAPSHITRAMRVRGGVNPFGESRYRLVWSDGRYVLSGGTYYKWAPGTPVEARNPEKNRALSSVVEIRPLPMYPGKHRWVLERWSQAEKFGSPERWYSPIEQGGTMRWCGTAWMPSAGPYPSQGDYEEAAYNFPAVWDARRGIDCLSEAAVMEAMGRVERGLASLPNSMDQRLMLATSAAESLEQRQDDEYEKWANDVLDEDGSPFDARTPGGQAEVHRLAESIGIRNHIF